MKNQNGVLTLLEKVLQKSVDEYNLDPNIINEDFANLVEEIEKFLDSPMAHFDVEIIARLLLGFPRRNFQVFGKLFEIKCRR